MSKTSIAGAARFAAALLLAGGCASVSYTRLDEPAGDRALGLDFGQPREAVEAGLRAAAIPFADAPGDADSILASRCPQSPARAPCRLTFGARGLYAAQVEVPPAETDDLVRAVERGLGAASRRPAAGASAEPGVSEVVAAWDRPGWSVTVSRSAPAAGQAAAVLRVELDAAAPPVVAGVPLGRRRPVVEQLLEVQGAAVVQRDDEATTYLGCPLGDGAALTCVVTFHQDRAAAVTEVHPTPAGDEEALEAWRAASERLAGEFGRPPASACPSAGPDRIGGDCTSTWSSARLLVVVGAHRNAGGEHRGGISVYTSWTYPPLAAQGGAAPEP